jgi:transcriptional regulator with XRE-family HTH domain
MIQRDTVGLYVRIKDGLFRPASELPPGAVDRPSSFWVTDTGQYQEGEGVQTFATHGSRMAQVGQEWWFLDVQDTDPRVQAKFAPRNDSLVKFGHRIQQRRKELSLSQADVAKRLSMQMSRSFSGPDVSKHEHGKGFGDRIDLVQAYACHLEIPMWELGPVTACIKGSEYPDEWIEAERLLHGAEEIQRLADCTTKPSISVDDLRAYATQLRRRAKALAKPVD